MCDSLDAAKQPAQSHHKRQRRRVRYQRQRPRALRGVRWCVWGGVLSPEEKEEAQQNMSPSLGRNTDSPPAREHQKASGLVRTNRRHLARVGQTRLNRPDGSGHHGAHGDVPRSRSAAAHVLPLRHRQPTTLRPQMPASASIRRASGRRRQTDGTWPRSVANLKNLGISWWLQSLRVEARHCPSISRRRASRSASDWEIWAAAGFDDTLLRWQMKPEVVNGEKWAAAI